MKNSIDIKALTTIAEAFTADLAARYDLPEMTGTGFISIPGAADCLVLRHAKPVTVRPRGQVAGFVKAMHVEVTVCAEGRDVVGELTYGYSHHSGGRNGMTHRFVIVTEDSDKYGEEGVAYSDMVDSRTAYILERNTACKVHAATARLAAEKAAAAPVAK